MPYILKFNVQNLIVSYCEQTFTMVRVWNLKYSLRIWGRFIFTLSTYAVLSDASLYSSINKISSKEGSRGSETTEGQLKLLPPKISSLSSRVMGPLFGLGLVETLWPNSRSIFDYNKKTHQRHCIAATSILKLLKNQHLLCFILLA